LSQLLVNGYPNFAAAPSPALAQLDDNRDGRVSRRELEEYYLRNLLPLVRIHPALNADPYADSVNAALFRLLDRNKDGRLSKAEVVAAEKLLDQLDMDDDECLSALELAPSIFTRGATGANRSPSMNQFAISRPGWEPKGIAQQFLQRYDKDKDYQLDA